MNPFNYLIPQPSSLKMGGNFFIFSPSAYHNFGFIFLAAQTSFLQSKKEKNLTMVKLSAT